MAFGLPGRGTKRAREPLNQAGLLEYAAKSLGARMQSERDLRRKMQNRAEPGPAGSEDVNVVIAKLKELRYLSDERFAADFARLRQENRSFGRRRVQQDLQQKGIAGDLISTTLDTTYEHVDEAMLVRRYLERKRLQPPTDDKSTARMLRRLTGAGFSSKTIFRVFREMRSGEAVERAEALVEEE